jgi:hypothetical protein
LFALLTAFKIFTVCTLAVGTTNNAVQEALAIFLQTRGLFTIAPALMLGRRKRVLSQGIRNAFLRRVSYHWHYFYFRLKCLRISFYGLCNGLLHHLFVILRVETALTITSAAKYFVRKALAVPV